MSSVPTGPEVWVVFFSVCPVFIFFPFQCHMSLPPALLPFSLSLFCSLCIALVPPGSVPLAGLAAHLSEIGTAAELELQYQRAVGHFIYIFAFWREKEENIYISFLNSFLMCHSSLRPASSHNLHLSCIYVTSSHSAKHQIFCALPLH